MPTAVVNADHTVTLPLHHGRSGGTDVWFVVTEASDSNHASAWGSSVSQKLANAKGTAAVQRVSVERDGTIVFPHTVDFSPTHVLAPGPTGFPPSAAAPGAVGEPGYSPLVELPDGAVLNAPQLANGTGAADKVVAIAANHRTVRYTLTDGFARGNPVVYMSTEASDAGAAAIEDVTFAPALNAAPAPGEDGTDSARATLAAFTNGPTGAANPQRQGLNSALLGEGDPLNVLAWTPNQGRYSPLWDVHLSRWAPGVRPTRQTEVARIADLADQGQILGFPSGPWRPSNFIVNCPIIAQR
ncbi:MAG TPA: hypothetical protein VFJ94_10910 [Intrasporangium sp.]|uniref:hypothetical protein n=1 Tax=Intrasporangium sp. TaxID=1925024 RepID=UPI002D767D7A|nr:hypothetical protein [Intrasporangium sp.]HET7399019.1 hypothetical protein [Intrasporangium sp.]